MGVWFYSSSVRKWRPNACKVGKQNSKETHGVIVGKKAFNSLRNPHHNSIQAIQRVHRLQRLSATGSAATSLRAHSRCPPRGRRRHRTVRSGERPGSLRVLAQLLELAPPFLLRGSSMAHTVQGSPGSVCLGQTAEKEVPARSGACRLPGPGRSDSKGLGAATGGLGIPPRLGSARPLLRPEPASPRPPGGPAPPRPPTQTRPPPAAGSQGSSRCKCLRGGATPGGWAGRRVLPVGASR